MRTKSSPIAREVASDLDAWFGAARRYAEQHLDMDHHIAAFTARVAELTGG